MAVDLLAACYVKNPHDKCLLNHVWIDVDDLRRRKGNSPTLCRVSLKGVVVENPLIFGQSDKKGRF